MTGDNPHSILSEFILLASNVNDIQSLCATSHTYLKYIMEYDFSCLCVVNKITDKDKFDVYEISGEKSFDYCRHNIPEDSKLLDEVTKMSVLNNKSGDSSLYKLSFLRDEDANSIMVLPLKASNNIVGYMIFLSRLENAYDVKQVSVARMLSHTLSISVDRVMMIEALNFSNKLLVEHAKELEFAQKQLNRAKNDAESANREKSSFLARMSHEIRTPMHGVIGGIDLLKMTKVSDEQKNCLEIVGSSMTHMMDIINDILDLSKIEAGELELSLSSVGIVDLLNSIHAICQSRAAQAGLIFECKIDGDVPHELYLDKMRMKQILLNLINNALRFTQSGAITVTVSMSDKNSLPHLQLMVSDTGMGIPDDKINDLFSPYTQLAIEPDAEKNGTGLGLAICHQLVELMDGSIEVTSAVEQGSHFSVSIPALEPGQDNGIVIDNELLGSGDLQLENTTILVVEDNSVNQLIAKTFLESFGCAVTLANNGKQACDILEKQQFDLIFMDAQMPVMGGCEATKYIRDNQLADNIPIIALSANVIDVSIKQFFTAGMDGYLSKPFKREELFTVTQRYLNQ